MRDERQSTVPAQEAVVRKARQSAGVEVGLASGGGPRQKKRCGQREEKTLAPYTERYGTTTLIPPIFAFLPTYSNFTRGELTIGRSLRRNCPRSLPCVSSAPVHSCRGSSKLSSKLRSVSKSTKKQIFSRSWGNIWRTSGTWKKKWVNLAPS